MIEDGLNVFTDVQREPAAPIGELKLEARRRRVLM